MARLLLPLALAASPADRVPTPRPETCVVFTADPAEGEIAGSVGLGYDEVRKALGGVIQAALYCPQPAGLAEVNLTFELVVGCNGIVSRIEASDNDGAPATYVSCVQSVVAKADFPAHDMPDGFPVTYPVRVAW
jgi:hypothetical protein